MFLWCLGTSQNGYGIEYNNITIILRLFRFNTNEARINQVYRSILLHANKNWQSNNRQHRICIYIYIFVGCSGVEPTLNNIFEIIFFANPKLTWISPIHCSVESAFMAFLFLKWVYILYLLYIESKDIQVLGLLNSSNQTFQLIHNNGKIDSKK